MTAIMLRRLGDHVVVEVELDGARNVWAEVIREYIDSPFSHIVEASGIRACAAQQTPDPKVTLSSLQDTE